MTDHYLVTVREVHVVTFQVSKSTAKTPEEAIKTVEAELQSEAGKAKRLDDSFEYSHTLNAEHWSVTED